MDKLLPLIKRAPWGRFPNIGDVWGRSRVNGVNAGVGANVPPEAIARLDSFADWVTDPEELQADVTNVQSTTVDKESEITSISVKARGVYAAGVQSLARFRVREDQAEVVIAVKTYDSVVPYQPMQLRGSVGGAAVADIGLPIARDGTLTGSVPFGGGFISFAEYETGDAAVKALVIRVRRLPKGVYQLGAHLPAALAAGQVQALNLRVKSPQANVDRQVLDDSERLEMINDGDMIGLMSDFFAARNELSKRGVDEYWWLQSYARYIVPNPQAFTDTNALTEEEVTIVKARMLQPSTWESFPDLTGFLEKLYNDAGCLRALAQTTNPR
jgi:hypothetical protein